MALEVRGAAHHLGVSNRDVLRMIKEGSLRARRSGAKWLIEPDDLPPVPRTARPMSARLAWATIIGPDEARWLTPPERAKLTPQIARAVEQGDVLRIGSWLAGRSPARRYTADNLPRLIADRRIVPSGAADERAQLFFTRARDLYVQPGNREDVVRDHRLRHDPAGLVWLRDAGWELRRPAPLLLVVADLVDHGQEMEARRILRIHGRAVTADRSAPASD